MPRIRKSVGNYKHISLVRGNSRRPSGGPSGHHVGGMFCCPMRFDRSFQVFLYSCIGVILPASGLMSASQAGKYIKTKCILRNTPFSTRLCLLFPSKTNFFALPLAASRPGRQPQTTYCLRAVYKSFVAARALLHNTNYNVRRSNGTSLAQLERDQA